MHARVAKGRLTSVPQAGVSRWAPSRRSGGGAGIEVFELTNRLPAHAPTESRDSALGALCAILTYDPCSPMSRRYCIVGGGSSWTATGRDIDPDLRAAARLPFAASTSPVIS